MPDFIQPSSLFIMYAESRKYTFIYRQEKKESLYCKILKDVVRNIYFHLGPHVVWDHIYFNFSVYILLRRAGISLLKGWCPSRVYLIWISLA